MSDEAHDIFDWLMVAVTAAAWAEYDRVRDAALAEYKRVTAPALAEFVATMNTTPLADLHRTEVPDTAWNGRTIFPEAK